MESYSVQAVLSAVDKGFSSTINSALGSLKGVGNTATKATGSIMKIASGIGVFKAVSAATSMLANSVDGAIDRYDTLNKYPRVLQNLGYSTSEANKSTSKLKNGIQGLPTTLDDVVKTSQRLTVLTGNLDKSTDTTLALNNAFLASSASVSDTSRGMEQYLQMLSTGSVDLMSWRTLQETMGYALRETSKQLGIASGDTNELYKALQSGAITFDQFNDALIECSTRTGGFADMALDASKGIKTSMANIQTAIKSGIEGSIAAIDVMLERNGLPKIVDMLETVRKKIGEVFGSYETLDDGTKVFNGGLMEAISKFDDLKGLAISLGTVLAGAFTLSGGLGYLDFLPGVFNAASAKASMLSNAIRKIPDIGYRAETTLTKMGAKFSGLVDVSKNVASRIGGIIPNGVKAGFSDVSQTAISTASLIKDRFNQIGESIPNSMKRIGSGIGSGLKASANVGLQAMNGMVSALTSVMGVALKAVGPAAIVGLALVGLGVLQGQFGTQLDGFIQMATTKGPQIIQSLVDGITSKIPALAAAGSTLLVSLMNMITANLPAVAQGGMQIITALVQGLITNLPQIIPAAINLITTLITTIVSLIPQVMLLGLEILAALASGLLSNIDLVTTSIVTIINQIVEMITSNLPTILLLGIEILMMLAQGIVQSAPQIIVAILNGLTMLVDTISSFLPVIMQSGVQIIMMLVQGLISSLPGILQAGVQLIQSLVEGIASNLPQIVMAGFQIILMLITGLLTMLPDILKAGWEIIKALADGIVNAIPNVLTAVIDGVKDLFTGLWDFITGKNAEGADQTKAKMEELAESIDNSTGKASEKAKANTEDMSIGVTTNTEKMTEQAKTLAESMNTGVTAETGFMKDGVTSNIADMSSMSSADIATFAESIGASTASASALATGNMAGMSSGVSSSVATIGEATSLATSSVQNMSDGISASMSAVDAAVSQVSTNVQGMASGVSTSMSMINTSATTVTSGMQEMKSGIVSSLTAIQTSYQTTFTQLGSITQSAMSRISTTVQSGVNKVTSTVQSGMNRVRSIVTNGVNTVKSAVSSGMSNVVSLAISGMSRFVSAIQSGMNQSVAAIQSGVNSMVAAVNSMSGQMYSAGYNASMGLANGIEAGAGAAIAAAQSVANQVSAIMASALKEHSPSRVTKKIGAYASEGLAIGILGMMSMVKKSATRVADTAANYMVPDFKTDMQYAFAGDMTMHMEAETFGGVSEALEDIKEELVGLRKQKLKVQSNLYLDGRKVSKSTATYDRDEIAAIEKKQNLLNGIR